MLLYPEAATSKRVSFLETNSLSVGKELVVQS